MTISIKYQYWLLHLILYYIICRISYVDLSYSANCRFEYLLISENMTSFSTSNSTSSSNGGLRTLARLCVLPEEVEQESEEGQAMSSSRYRSIRSRTNNVDMTLQTDNYNLKKNRGFHLVYSVTKGVFL